MKAVGLWISATAIGVALALPHSAWSQTTESESSTVTTVPAAPVFTSKTVTKKIEVSPPVVVTPPSTSSETTTTTQSDVPAPTVQEKTSSKTAYGPLGGTHSATHEKSTSD
jgi:hypothetical protein